jgi:hypothetical protein
MNTMKGFYASISSASRLQGPYMEALAEITKMSHQQSKALQSDLAWQEWSQQDPEAATREA